MRPKDGIPFDGFGSVVEMLQRADAPFREKILQNLRRRDPGLADRIERNLRPARAHTRESGREVDSRATLERSQRAAFTKNYGQ